MEWMTALMISSQSFMFYQRVQIFITIMRCVYRLHSLSLSVISVVINCIKPIHAGARSFQTSDCAGRKIFAKSFGLGVPSRSCKQDYSALCIFSSLLVARSKHQGPFGSLDWMGLWSGSGENKHLGECYRTCALHFQLKVPRYLKIDFFFLHISYLSQMPRHIWLHCIDAWEEMCSLWCHRIEEGIIAN